jgi:hypothetical protein
VKAIGYGFVDFDIWSLDINDLGAGSYLGWVLPFVELVGLIGPNEQIQLMIRVFVLEMMDGVYRIVHF